jgi:hypothetical protein
MPLSHAEREMLWIHAWGDLHELVDKERLTLVDEEGQEMDVDDCKTRIQDQAYAGEAAVFERVWFKGRPALRVSFHTAEAGS